MNKKLTLLLLFLAAPVLTQAVSIQYSTTLSGAAEEPPVESPATGQALVTHDLDAHTLRIQAAWQDLVGVTTVAHIHAPTENPFEGTVGVAVTSGTLPGFPADVTSGTYDFTLDLTDATSYTPAFLNLAGGTSEAAEGLLTQALESGSAYFNIHSSFRQGGEIRGFFTPVPDAGATAPLLLMGLAGAVYIRRFC